MLTVLIILKHSQRDRQHVYLAIQTTDKLRHSESANFCQDQSLLVCFEMCSKIVEDGVIGQNTYDFLSVFYNNFGRISYRFCSTVDFMPK